MMINAVFVLSVLALAAVVGSIISPRIPVWVGTLLMSVALLIIASGYR